MKNYELATFAGGCFWCTEAIFKRLKGVMSVTPGYSGGDMENPSYDKVSSGSTGHAEAVQIKFNPQEVSFIKLLEVFFKTHDPTQVDGQGHDIGTQYRSMVFYHTDEQKSEIEKVIEKINDSKIYSTPIVTQVVQFKSFYEAEDYHKNYYDNNKNAAYCRLVIDPKIKKLEELFGSLLK